MIERGIAMSGEKKGYFEAALSDFVFDVAAGGAIRHLVDRGYSVNQIMKELSYPVPRDRVEQAVLRHMTETGILIAGFPEDDKKEDVRILEEKDSRKLYDSMMRYIEEYGLDNSYMECPFGKWQKNDENKLLQVISCLTSREQEYILGIRWEKDIMYHRLNDRMREIGIKLSAHTNEEWKFYFVKYREG